MKRHSVIFSALIVIVLGAGHAAAGATCEGLANLAFPGATITAAESVPAGTYHAPDGEVFTNMPAFCRVAATLTPTSDSDIKVEVWMPNSGWNGQYVGQGNSNIGGLISYSSLAAALQLFGLAAASTDMGTSPAATDPAGGLVLIGHPEKQIDYATRSTHLMTVFAKQIIATFYGEPAQHSFFYGCSTGGGQGLHEALQFPGDYDGIFAGAPTLDPTGNSAGEVWDYGAFNRIPVNLTAAQVSAINAAILKQCVGQDGGASSDNFLTDPRDCHWNPLELQCTGGSSDAPTCLTALQATAMRKFYRGTINPRTGQRIYPGRSRGSEINNYGPLTIEAENQPNTSAIYWAFGADFDWRTFDFNHDMDQLIDDLAARLNANTADLAEFKSHGGKLFIWQGLADPRVPPLNTIDYYERLITSQTPGDGGTTGERKEGLRRTQEFARLFLAPGVGHCGGGAGADTFDSVTPVFQWVEQGIAPDQLIASKIVNGVTTFTRPLCPYPALPRYRDVGDPTQASSFECIADEDHDQNQPPAPKYVDDGDNYPIVPITAPTGSR
jgi:feruloyl esterase